MEFFFVIDLDGNGKFDAYIFAGQETNESLQIISIALYKKYEGRGWGNKLIQYLIYKAQKSNFGKIDLHVETTNHNALTLYKKFGFKQVGNAPNYYGSKRDAYIMSVEI